MRWQLYFRVHHFKPGESDVAIFSPWCGEFCLLTAAVSRKIKVDSGGKDGSASSCLINAPDADYLTDDFEKICFLAAHCNAWFGVEKGGHPVKDGYEGRLYPFGLIKELPERSILGRKKRKKTLSQAKDDEKTLLSEEEKTAFLEVIKKLKEQVQNMEEDVEEQAQRLATVTRDNGLYSAFVKQEQAQKDMDIDAYEKFSEKWESDTHKQVNELLNARRAEKKIEWGKLTTGVKEREVTRKEKLVASLQKKIAKGVAKAAAKKTKGKKA